MFLVCPVVCSRASALQLASVARSSPPLLVSPKLRDSRRAKLHLVRILLSSRRYTPRLSSFKLRIWEIASKLDADIKQSIERLCASGIDDNTEASKTNE